MTSALWNLKQVMLSGRHRPRLDGISVDIPPGVTAILGHSGAGKTSLLNLLVGFELPDSGFIEAGLPTGGACRLPVFWSPADLGLWPHLSVREHLQLVSPPQHQTAEHLDAGLSAFDLTDKSSARPDQLSQGERGRLAVARACAAEPAILVLDEPLVHVDPSQLARYWGALQRERHRNEGQSLVFSTHAPEVVVREAQFVICLTDGKLTYAGDVARLYYHPPDAQTAWALGPVNWLPAEEASTWLTGPPLESCCLRPEQLSVTRASDSPLVVEQAHFAGSLCEVEVRDDRSGRKRTFYHRPARNGPQPGERIWLQLLSLCLLCLALCGCLGANAQEPLLKVRDVRAWTLPAEGHTVPAPRAVHATEERELYVLDNAGRILVYDEEGSLLRSWWMPEYSVGKPEKICRFRDGRLAVADTHYHRVVFFDLAGNETGRMGQFGHGSGEFVYPVAVVDDEEGNFYVCEYGGNDRVQKFDAEGHYLLQFGGFGTELGQFQRPSGIVWREGKVYVVDAFNNRVQVFADSGEFLGVLGGEEHAVPLEYPYDIAQSRSGDLFIVEYTAGRVTRLGLDGKLLGRYGKSGAGEGEFTTPWGLTVDQDGRIYVADTENRRVVKLEL